MENGSPYLENWKKNNLNLIGNIMGNAQLRMFLPWQTNEGLKITTHWVTHVIKFWLMEGMSFVLTEQLNQNCLEEYFKNHKSLGWCNDNHDLKQFGY